MIGDFRANQETIARKLVQLQQRYEAWAEPINRTIQANISRINRDGYTGNQFFQDISKARDEQTAREDVYHEMYRFFDELCPLYLAARDEDRVAIRALVAGKNGVTSALLGYVTYAAQHLHSPADCDWLRWGLAAESIENCCLDYRDVLLALAELWVASENAGIDPQPDFTAVAALSDTNVPCGGSTPVCQMLANFHSYAVLAERKRRV